MIRAVIVEDEPLAGRYLKALLDETEKVEVVGMARDGDTGLYICSEEAPDAAFLDICLPGPDGMELAAHLSLLQRPPLIVFTTGHADRACEAFHVEAVHYLLKPLVDTKVREAVARLEERLAYREARGHGNGHEEVDPSTVEALGLRDGRLPVKNRRDGVLKLLPRWEIVAALVHDRRTWIHTAREEFPTYYPLCRLRDWMKDPPFPLVAREAMVNIQAVEEVIYSGGHMSHVRIRDRQKTRVELSETGAARLSSLLKPPL